MFINESGEAQEQESKCAVGNAAISEFCKAGDGFLVTGYNGGHVSTGFLTGFFDRP
jgi:hypothetical protein